MKRINSMILYRDRDLRLEVLPVVTFFQSCGIHVYVQDSVLIDDGFNTIMAPVTLGSYRVYNLLYKKTDFSVTIYKDEDDDRHNRPCRVVGDNYIELRYKKNPFELITELLEGMETSYDINNEYDARERHIGNMEGRHEIHEMGWINMYIQQVAPQFFDVIELCNVTAFFSITNTECTSKLDEMIKALLYPSNEPPASIYTWDLFVKGLKCRSAVLNRIFNPNSPSELFVFEPDFAVTHDEFMSWLYHGNYKYIPVDFMHENCITLHSDVDASDLPDKEMMCGYMDYSSGLYQNAREHWRKCTRYIMDTPFHIARSYQKDMNIPAYASIRLSRKRSASTWYQEYLDKIESDFEKGNITLIELYQIYVAMKHLSSVTCEDNQEFGFDWTPELEIRSGAIMRKINKYLTSYKIDQFDSNDLINAILLRYNKEFTVDTIDKNES